MIKKYYLTPSSFKKHKEEYENLQRLKKEKKLKIKELRTREIWRAEDSNPDYETLEIELAFVEKKIKELENILRNVELIKKRVSLKKKKITLGMVVEVDINNHRDEFMIVESFEAEPSKKKISNESPLGKALIGKTEGEIVEVKTPIVSYNCKIIKIKI